MYKVISVNREVANLSEMWLVRSGLVFGVCSGGLGFDAVLWWWVMRLSVKFFCVVGGVPETKSGL